MKKYGCLVAWISIVTIMLTCIATVHISYGYSLYDMIPFGEVFASLIVAGLTLKLADKVISRIRFYIKK